MSRPCHCVALREEIARHCVALQEEIAYWRKVLFEHPNSIIRGRPSQALHPACRVPLQNLASLRLPLLGTTFLLYCYAEMGVLLAVCLQPLHVIRTILRCVRMVILSRRRTRPRGLCKYPLEGRHEALLLGEFLLAIVQFSEEDLLLGQHSLKVACPSLALWLQQTTTSPGVESRREKQRWTREGERETAENGREGEGQDTGSALRIFFEHGSELLSHVLGVDPVLLCSLLRRLYVT